MSRCQFLIGNVSLLANRKFRKVEEECQFLIGNVSLTNMIRKS